MMDQEIQCRRFWTLIKEAKSGETQEKLRKDRQTQLESQEPITDSDLKEVEKKLHKQQKELRMTQKDLKNKSEVAKEDIEGLKDENSQKDQQLNLANMRIKELERFIRNAQRAKMAETKSQSLVTIPTQNSVNIQSTQNSCKFYLQP